MKITFIRHSTLNIAPGICYGQSDVDVSANFDNEAQALRQTLHNKTFDAVFTSPLQRCSKLAKACGYAHAVPDSRLKELNFGAWEMKAWEEIVDPQIELWYSNWLDERPTDGESFYDMIKRFESFINEQKTMHNSRHILVFTHSGIIRAAGILAGIYNFKTAFEAEIGYAKAYEMEL